MKSSKNSSKKRRIMLVIVAILVVAYIAFVFIINHTMTASVSLDDLVNNAGSLIAYIMPPYGDGLRKATVLPAADNAGVRELFFFDLSDADLSSKIDELKRASFSSNTLWPDSVPHDFSAERIMELGMNPGLGIRELHDRGITGEGVGIAVIDFNLLAGHEQYADRLRLYELYRTINQTAVMHSAVASIAAGKDTGTAPGASLYYIATMYGTYLPPFSLTNYSNLVTCIDRILEINTYLPESEKIRVVSISRAFRTHELGGASMKRAIERANEAGVFVITCSPEVNYEFYLSGIGRDPEADPNELSSYDLSILDANRGNFAPNTLLVPIDSRTTAGYTGESDYIFYRRGGYSWGTPWLAGVYALCVQVYPEITPELFIRLALDTGDSYNGGYIVNPVRLIEELDSGQFS